jgi:2-oxo-3-hexenedioate decarboxylase
MRITSLDDVDIDALAAQLLECSLRASLLPQPSRSCDGFDVSTAYRVLDSITTRRCAAGWRVVGYKIGFTNGSLWKRYGVSHPIWAPIWSSTVRFASRDHLTLELAEFAQPRIEPEVVFKLNGPVAAHDDDERVLRSVEWIAPGFEIVQCHYEDWRFSAADCIADFGLHGTLTVHRWLPETSSLPGR